MKEMSRLGMGTLLITLVIHASQLHGQQGYGQQGRLNLKEELKYFKEEGFAP